MITYDESRRLFHLYNDLMSVVLCVRADEDGCDELLMAHFGAPLDDPGAALPLINERSGASFDSLRQILPYACPTDGRGERARARSPACPPPMWSGTMRPPP